MRKPIKKYQAVDLQPDNNHLFLSEHGKHYYWTTKEEEAILFHTADFAEEQAQERYALRPSAIGVVIMY